MYRSQTTHRTIYLYYAHGMVNIDTDTCLYIECVPKQGEITNTWPDTLHASNALGVTDCYCCPLPKVSILIQCNFATGIQL